MLCLDLFLSLLFSLKKILAFTQEKLYLSFKVRTNYSLTHWALHSKIIDLPGVIERKHAFMLIGFILIFFVDRRLAGYDVCQMIRILC